MMSHDFLLLSSSSSLGEFFYLTGAGGKGHNFLVAGAQKKVTAGCGWIGLALMSRRRVWQTV
ncbi:MAG: hypothetical protein ACOY32_07385 [Thermodesulfobacteriota bacterium]